MDSTTPGAAVAGPDRRRAHRRVGAGATASFLVLLLLGAGAHATVRTVAVAGRGAVHGPQPPGRP